MLGATVLDDTDRVRAERARRAAENRFETGFEQAGIGAAIVALDGVPARVNLAVRALMGRRGDLLVGRLWAEYTHPDEVPLWQVMAPRVEGVETRDQLAILTRLQCQRAQGFTFVGRSQPPR